MKGWAKPILLSCAGTLLLYGGIYASLRATGYFVHQSFLGFGCGEVLMARLRAKHPEAERLAVYVDVERIGCGRIQKEDSYAGESALKALFLPLRELEMHLRGHGELRLRAVEQRVEDAGSEGTYIREFELGAYTVPRSGIY